MGSAVYRCCRGEERKKCCRIRSYLSTVRKQGCGALLALEGACKVSP